MKCFESAWLFPVVSWSPVRTWVQNIQETKHF